MGPLYHNWRHIKTALNLNTQSSEIQNLIDDKRTVVLTPSVYLLHRQERKKYATYVWSLM
jgi:hypothetical protein